MCRIHDKCYYRPLASLFTEVAKVIEVTERGSEPRLMNFGVTIISTKIQKIYFKDIYNVCFE